MLTDQWQAALPLVRSPARYTDAEWNAYRKPLDEAAARAVLVYPDVYEAGVCDYGLGLLYQIVNEHAHYAADRAYLPWPDMRQAMRSRGLLLSGLESGRPLRDFDIVGIALPHPLCFTAVPLLLTLAGIPLTQAERSPTDPIVLGGGAAAANPEPVADFFDAILLGEGEEAILEIMRAVAQTRGEERSARQRALAAIQGVYVPVAGQAAVRHRIVDDLACAPLPYRPVVPFVESSGECACVEVSRGCACESQLCPARHLSGHARARPPDVLAEGAWKAVRSTGYDQVALLGPDGCSADEFAAAAGACAEAVRDENVSISLPRMRPAAVSAAIQRVRTRAVDIEVGPASDRLRSALQMQSVSEVLEAVADSVQAGVRSIRLHLTVGLPGETDDDVRCAGALLKDAARAARAAASGSGAARVAANVSAFVPQPQTPFQWFGAASPQLLEDKLAILQEAAPRRDVRVHLPGPQMVRLSAALARGDRTFARGLSAGCEAGLQPISAAADSSPELWLRTLGASGCDVSACSSRDIALEDHLPWGHLTFASSCQELRALAHSILDSG